MSALEACCHDNFEWYGAAGCQSCGIARKTWERLAIARTDTLINYLNGDSMTTRTAIDTLIGTPSLPVTVLDGGRAPIRAHAGDAGLDLYAATSRMIEFGTVTSVPLGVAVAIPPGHVGLLTLRSSLGQEGLVIPNAPGVIDAGYRGEISATLTMAKDDGYKIIAGERICQLVIVPCITPQVEIVDQLPEASDGRGTGGFGSTGRA